MCASIVTLTWNECPHLCSLFFGPPLPHFRPLGHLSLLLFNGAQRLLVHLVAPAAVVPRHLVHHLQQPPHLAAVSPVLVVEHVVAVPASLRQPPERLSLALDVLLDRLLAQEIPAGEEHHGVPPNPLPEELHVLLHGPPVLHGEG